MNATLRLIAAAATVLASMSAQAVHVTSLSGSTVYPFPVENYFGAGAKAVAPGITWSSESGGSVFGYVNGYGFNSNGNWSGAGVSMIGTNDGTSTMTLTFDNAVSGVGAFLNWARQFDGSSEGNAPVIAVYGASNLLLESYALTFATGGGGNSGEFHGFQRGSADVKSMTFSGAYIGAANLEVVTTAAVPEPETYALMLAGLLAVGSVARRRRNA